LHTGIRLLPALLLLAGCLPAVRPAPASSAPPLRPLWRLNLADHGFFAEYDPEEATGPVALADGLTVAVAAADGIVRCVAVRDGRVTWRFDAGGAPQGRLAQAGRLLYVASDAGALVALESTTGKEAWRARMPGAVAAGPVVHEGRLLVITDEERLRALDAETGKWLWDYTRDRPDRFVLYGAAEPLIHDGRVFAGFADGTLVSLVLEDGSLVWKQDLVTTGSREFTDVDTRPVVHGGRVFAASSSGGLHALELETGTPVWRVPVRGARSPALDGDALLVPTSDGLLLRIGVRDGRIRYRVRLADEGGVGELRRLARWWTVASPQSGLIVLNPASGLPVQRLDSGYGVSAAPASTAGVTVVLSNGGYLYGYRLATTAPRDTERGGH